MNHPIRHPGLWRLYLVLCIAAAAANVLHAVTVGGLSPVRVLGLVFGCVALVPLAGFVRQRAIAPKALWLAVFFIAIFVVAALLAVALAYAAPRTGDALKLAAAAAFAAPYLFALQQYLHHSPQLWRPDDQA